MTRINHVDQALLLLQEKLQRLNRGRAGRAAGVATATPRPLARLQSIAALDDLSDEDFKRTMIRALLAEELGDGVASDPAFQGVVDEVFRIVSESEQGRRLIDEAAHRLRAEP